MRTICLTLPTNRACAPAIAALVEEARYAARRFGVEVCVLILDTSDAQTFADHATTVRAATVRTGRDGEGVTLLHLGEDDQRRVLRDLIQHAESADPAWLLDLMLPDGVSYGACTNRAFLLAAALGCESVHRRDSDSRYQQVDGETIFPIHHELLSLGKRAGDARDGVTRVRLDPADEHKPVSMVGSSFIGELSVDIGDIQARDPSIYYDVVSLWAASHRTPAEKRQLVDESFTGAGVDPFTRDRSTLTIVDPMMVDMCNVSFYQVYEQMPLPPAKDTIGSDYFLMHVVRSARLPGVHHNRNIENFFTRERRTDAGFIAYQMRLTKFFLSMLYFHVIYDRMADAGASLLDERCRIRPSTILPLVTDSTRLDKRENEERLAAIDRAYRTLGGRYAAFADLVAGRRRQLLDEAEADIWSFARLMDAWAPLLTASKGRGFSKPEPYASQASTRV